MTLHHNATNFARLWAGQQACAWALLQAYETTCRDACNPSSCRTQDKNAYLALGVAMDVVVTPIGSEGTSWSLTDRLGRALGAIEMSGLATRFEIKPELSGGLRSVPTFHATLSDAMTAIARHMQGACALDSQNWD